MGRLHFTSDIDPWQERKWQTVEAQVADGAIRAELQDNRPMVLYLSAMDERGALTSTQHVEITAPE